MSFVDAHLWQLTCMCRNKYVRYTEFHLEKWARGGKGSARDSAPARGVWGHAFIPTEIVSGVF